jgi:hypothetical protein
MGIKNFIYFFVTSLINRVRIAKIRKNDLSLNIIWNLLHLRLPFLKNELNY